MNARETVETDTPAALATCLIVTATRPSSRVDWLGGSLQTFPECVKSVSYGKTPDLFNSAPLCHDADLNVCGIVFKGVT
ncbi:hypothetical protein GCM10020220_039330 [Nonomuraea rubra]